MEATPGTATVAVAATEADGRERARQLARDLGLVWVEQPEMGRTDLVLTVTPARLELRVLRGPTELRGGHAIAADLSKVDAHSPAGRRLNQPLLRAVGERRGKPPRSRVLDATAGLGEDAWLLASAGCEVTAVERHPVVAALLEDGVNRAASDHPDRRRRLRVVRSQGLEMLRRGGQGVEVTVEPSAEAGSAGVEVVYLDPMFPARRKRLERKSRRVLRWLVGEDADAERMLTAARGVVRRVVVKRPRRAEPLGGIQPVATHSGRAVRYDVYAGKA